MARKVRNYTEEFKQEAVKLAFRKPRVADAAKDLGIPAPTLHGWVNDFKAKQHTPQTQEKSDDIATLVAENRRLHKELAIAKEEKEILKKAAAYFAQHQK